MAELFPIPEGFEIETLADEPKLHPIPEGFEIVAPGTDPVAAAPAPSAPSGPGLTDYLAEVGKSAYRGVTGMTSDALAHMAAMDLTSKKMLLEIDKDIRRVPKMSDKEFDELFMKINKWVPGRTLASSRAGILATAQNLRSGRIKTPQESPFYKDWMKGLKTDLVSQPEFKGAEFFDKLTREVFPEDPRFKDSWTSAFGSGLGTGGLFLGVGSIPKIGAAASAALGIHASGGEAIQRARLARATHEQMVEAARMAAWIGLTEQAPIEVILGRFPILRGLKGPIKKMLASAIAESGQEGVQLIWQNHTSKSIYDPKMSIWKDLKKSMIVGGLVGATFSGAVEGGRAIAGKGKTSPLDPEANNARAVFERMMAASGLDEDGLIELRKTKPDEFTALFLKSIEDVESGTPSPVTYKGSPAPSERAPGPRKRPLELPAPDVIYAPPPEADITDLEGIESPRGRVEPGARPISPVEIGAEAAIEPGTAREFEPDEKEDMAPVVARMAEITGLDGEGLLRLRADDPDTFKAIYLTAREDIGRPSVEAKAPAAPEPAPREPEKAPTTLKDTLETETEEAEAIRGDELGSMVGAFGTGIAEGLYRRLWTKAKAGETSDLGDPSVFLQAAKKLRNNGDLQNYDEFRKFIKSLDAAIEGKTGDEYQQAVRSVINDYTTKTIAEENTRILKAAGYTADQISEMNSIERSAAVAEALEQGVHPIPAGYEIVTPGTPDAPVKVETAADVRDAEASVETDPTEAQKKAGNYSKGHINVHGLDISIENAKGAIRRGVDRDGKTWEVEMPAAYGYVKRTEGADKDQVDVFVGDNPSSKKVFMIDQLDLETGAYDETKAILGAKSAKEARNIYVKGFSDGRGSERIGSFSSTNVEGFKEWIRSGNTKKAFDGSLDAALRSKGVVRDETAGTPEAGKRPVGTRPDEGAVEEAETLEAAKKVRRDVIAAKRAQRRREKEEAGKKAAAAPELTEAPTPETEAKPEGEVWRRNLIAARKEAKKRGIPTEDMSHKELIQMISFDEKTKGETQEPEKQPEAVGKPEKEADISPPTEAIMTAEDTGADMTVTLSENGPWDFNDTYPSPDQDKLSDLEEKNLSPFEGDPYTVEEVVKTLEGHIADLVIGHHDQRLAGEEIDRHGEVTGRGKRVQKIKRAIATLRNDIQLAKKEIARVTRELFSVWSTKAGAATLKVAELRADQETKTSSQAGRKGPTERGDQPPTVAPVEPRTPGTTIPKAAAVPEPEKDGRNIPATREEFIERIKETIFTINPAVAGPDGNAWRVKKAPDGSGHFVLKMIPSTPTKSAMTPAIRPLEGETWTLDHAAERAAKDAGFPVPEPVNVPTEEIAEYRQGEIGMELAAGEQVLTTTGRLTSPFPKVDLSTDRKAHNTEKRVDAWLMTNALEEARSRGDNFNASSFKHNLLKPQQADKDSAEYYLFDPDFVFDVPAPLIKDLAPQVEPKPAAGAAKGLDLTQAFTEFLTDPENRFKSIRDARDFAKEHGHDIKPGTAQAKQMEEQLELALVLTARDIIENAGEPHVAFDELVSLYDRQPNLSSRTAQSMVDQAYSTPAPLAYLSQMLAGIGPKTNIYEPTAGNGMMVTAADPQRVFANEIDKARVQNLESQGFLAVTERRQPDEQPVEMGEAGMVDVVIMNPPFGAVKDEDGKSIRFNVDDLGTTQIDHAIALNALKAMPDDGRAVMVVGSVYKQATNREDAYNAAAKRKFYYFLYEEYNVVDHFTVNGDLYKKQGAAWPVDVIVVKGRGKSSLPLPAVEAPRILDTWGDLRGELDGRPETIISGEVREPAGEAAPGGRVGVERPSPSVREDAEGKRPDTDRSGDQVREPVPVRPGRGERKRPGTGEQRPAANFREKLESRKRDIAERSGELSAAVEQEETPTQIEYVAASDLKPLNTLSPSGIISSTENALLDVEGERGRIDTFVAEELQYDPADLGKYFGAEQVDAVALAIYQIQRGKAFIIGDATGIGKGRVNAAMLRYAMIQGRKPVFVTEKPNLYGDMIRDLNDIGMRDFLGREVRSFMTNTGNSAVVPLDKEALDWFAEKDEAVEMGEKPPKKRGKFLTPATPTKAQKIMADIRTSGMGDFDIIFTTYDQMNTVEGQDTERRRFIRSIAPDAIISYDESHNAFGTKKERKKKNAEPDRAEMIRAINTVAHGVMFSSATYAKRPDGMDLYARTDLGDAVENIKDLGNTIAKGGVPLQQIIASMLADAGQYVRRERSFEGIDYNVDTVDVDTVAYENFSGSLKAIVDAEAWLLADPAYEKWKSEIRAEGAGQALDSAVGKAGVASANFTSLMHNVIDQFLLGLKAGPAAEAAIKAIQEGKKPALTMAKTNESFLKHFAADNNIEVGDRMEVDFKAVVENYLDRTRQVTVKPPQEGAKPYHRVFPLERASARTREMYAMAMEQIGTIENVPVSPITYITNKIEEAGYKVGEITGREMGVDYKADGTARYSKRPKNQIVVAGRRVTLNKFNNGKIDVLLLNQAGSTGLSAHASKSVGDDVRPRHMIIVQAEANVDTHMQILGRINRTGQVVLPSYSQLVAGVPAEMRIAAILAKKMASLSANTTAARKSAVSGDVVDFMNKYGDDVVAKVLAGNIDWFNLLAPSTNEEIKSHADWARKVTGKLILLPVKEQWEFLDQVTQQYVELIETLDRLGENDLEAKFVDLQAETLETDELKAATGTSPFQQAVHMEKVRVKAAGRAYHPDDLAGVLREELKMRAGTSTDNTFRQAVDFGRPMMKEYVKTYETEQDAWLKEQLKSAKPKAAAKIRAKSKIAEERFSTIAHILVPGSVVNIEVGGETLPAIVTKVAKAGKAQMPMALSNHRATLAIPTASREIKVNFSSVRLETDAALEGEVSAAGITVTSAGWNTPIADTLALFEESAKEGKEERYIITGNVVSGFDIAKGRGQILQFTDAQGRVKPGVLMGRTYDHEKFMETRPVRFNSAKQLFRFMDKVDTPEIQSSDGIVTVMKISPDQYEIELPKARRTGGQYFMQTSVVKASDNGFNSVGNRMRFRGPRQQTIDVLDAMTGHGAMFQTTSDQDVATEIIKEDEPGAPVVPTDALRKIEGSPAFDKWFGESKVVDAEGNPMVVYHGTDQEFEAFDPTRRGEATGAKDAKLGYFFATHREVAETYVDPYDPYDQTPGVRAINRLTRGLYGKLNNRILKLMGLDPQVPGKVVPAFLSIQNPLEIIPGEIMVDEFGETVEGVFGEKPVGSSPDAVAPAFYTEEHFTEALRRAKSKGHDGVVFRNIEDVGPEAKIGKMPAASTDIWVAFEPTQIKSPENRGTFDPTDPNIKREVEQKPEITDRLELRTDRAKEIEDLLKLAREILPPSVTVNFANFFLEGGKVSQDTSGFYNAIKRAIWVAMETSNNRFGTLSHEAIHALKDIGLFTPAEWAILNRMSQKVWMVEHRIQGRYGERYAEQFGVDAEEKMAEEGIAEAFAGYVMNGTDPQSGRVRAIFDKIQNFLERLRNLLAGHGFQSVEDIFKKVRTGAVATREPAVSRETGAEPGVADKPMMFQYQDSMGETQASWFTPPADMTLVEWAQQDAPIMGRIVRGANYIMPDLHVKTTAARRVLQDRFIDVKQFQKAIEMNDGQALAESMDAYLTESLYRGRTGQQLHNFRNDRWLPLLEEANRRGLSKEDIDLYLYAMHAAERNAYIASINPKFPDGGSGMTNAEARETIEKFHKNGKLADLQAIDPTIRQIITETRDVLRSAGLISDEMAAQWATQYQYYVPLRGWENDPNNDTDPAILMKGPGRGFDIRGLEAHPAYGRHTKADSPLAFILAQAQQAIARSEKNKVSKTFLRLVNNNPNPNIWEINKIVRKPVLDRNTGMVKMVYDRQHKLADNVVAAKVGGTQFYITIHHPGLAKAMKGLGNDQVGRVTRTLAGLNRYLAYVNTSLNPPFMIGNMLRDLQTGMFNLSEHDIEGLSTKILKDVTSGRALKGVWQGLGGRTDTEWSRHYRDFANAGGKITFFGLQDIDQIKDKIKADLKNLDPSNMRRIAKGLIGIKDIIDRANQTVENAIRLATYVRLVESGFTSAKAASAALELTVNFYRKGNVGLTLNAWYLFANAGIQGPMKTLSVLKHSKKARKFAVGLILAGAARDMLNRLWSDDDDDGKSLYDKIKFHEKERNFILLIPSFITGTKGGERIKFPLGFGLNVFDVFGAQIMSVMWGAVEPMEAAVNIMSTAVNAFNPIGGGANLYSTLSPTITDPIVDLALNESYGGWSIKPKVRDDRVPPPESQRYFKSVYAPTKWATTELNKLTGGSEVRPGAIDISPETLDYLFDFFAGGAGMFVGRSVNLFSKALISGEEIEPREIPFLRKVYGKKSKWVDRQLYYDIADDVLMTEKDIKRYRSTGQHEKAAKARKAYESQYRMIGLVKDAENRLRQIRKAKRRAKKVLEGEARKRQIERLEKHETRIMTMVRRRFYQLEKARK